MDSRQENAAWHDTFTIRATELDQRGRLSVFALCNLLQEAAGRHADALGVGVRTLLASRQTWVLARLSLQMAGMPRSGELRIETWPAEIAGMYAIRDFRWRSAEGTVLGLGSTAWVLFDLEAKKPVRPPDSLFSLHPDTPARALADPFDRLPVLDTPDAQVAFQVRYQEIDVNQHANNAAYVAWALEPLPANFLNTHEPATVELAYLGESFQGDEVTSSVERRGTEVLHLLQRAKGGGQVAVGRSTWRPARRSANAPAPG